MDFKWIGSKVECYSDSPLLQKGYSEFYTSFSYNGEEFRVGEFALFKHSKKSDLTKVGRLLCVFQSLERNIKHNGIVRWYSWARNMQHKLLKFDEKNEIIEEAPNSDTCVSLKDILKKCLVLCATLDEPVHLIKKYNLNPDVYFSCRYKIEHDQLLPYFSEDAMRDTANSDYVVGCNLNEKLNWKLGGADTSQDSDSSMEEETDLPKHIQGTKSTVVTDSSPLTKTTPIKITKPIYNKRKTSCTGSVISLSSEGSDLDEVHVKVTSPANPSKNLKLTPKSCGKGSYLSPLDKKLSVKRVLNDSFEDPPASPIFTYSIVNSNCNDPKQLKMKFKLTEAEPGVHLKIYPTILDDEIVHMKTSIKIKDLQEVKNRVEFSPDAKAKMSEITCETDTLRRRRAKAQTGSPYTPAQIGSTRRRSSRIIQRQSYAEYCSPEGNTPKRRVRRPSTDSHRSLALKTPHKERTETKKIILSKIDENDAQNRKNSPAKVRNHSICDNIQINGDNGIKNIHKSASKTQHSTSEYSKKHIISVDCSSSDESDSSSKSKEITLGTKHRLLERLKNNKGNANSNQDIEKDNSNEKLVVTTSRPKRNVGTPKRYINDVNSKIEKSSRSSRHLKNDSHVNDDEDNVNSSKIKCSVGRPKRYITDDECDNRNYKLDTKSLTIKNNEDGTTLSTKSSRIKRNVGRPKKYCESDNSDDETRKKDKSSRKSNHKTPSKNPYTKPASRSFHKNVQKTSAYTESDDDSDLEPCTPKAQRQKSTACTPRSVMKDTPSVRARMVREGMITPSVQPRNKAVLKENTPLSKARTQLHVSFVPKALPCREKEFADIINFLEGKLLDGCGGCMYVSGVPGTGKTATVTEVIRNLQKSVEKEDLPSFKYVNVNGMRLSEPRQSYVEIVRQLMGKTVHWEQAQTMLENKFVKSQKKCAPIILVVDELDILCTKRQDVVYNLLDWPTKANAQLIVITIANTMDLPERLLMGRVTSRLGLTRLTFQAYTHKQLQEIVSKRLAGISAFNPDAIQLVARKVASVSGDARRALDICRRAVEIAELEGKHTLVSMVHVNQALNAMITQPKVQAIKRCSRLERLILQAVVAEVERTGVEETNFASISTILVAIAALDGFQMVSSTIAMAAVSRLGACRLLLIDQKCNNIYQRIILNVSTDDVYYALTKTDL